MTSKIRIVCLAGLVAGGCGSVTYEHGGGDADAPGDAAPAICGNGVVSGNEECDGSDFGLTTCASIGFPGGFLVCRPNCEIDPGGCTAPATCGGSVRNGNEVCDGGDLGGATCVSEGYTGGTLLCLGNCAGFNTAACMRDPACGNNVAETGEPCDGNDLAGQSCESRGFAYGTLRCKPGCTAFDAAECFGSADCGNGRIDPDEACDGVLLAGRTCTSFGFAGGALRCNAACAGFDLSACDAPPGCGDGVRGVGEACDGADLAGESCVTAGFDAGTLRCLANCADFDLSACVDNVVCGDGVQEAPEICDGADLGGATCVGIGRPPGILRCAANCGSFDTAACDGTPGCGNGAIEGSEVCDPPDFSGLSCIAVGYNSGSLGCSANCGALVLSGCFNATCDDGVREGSEVCDGTDLGGHTCVTEGFDGGTLLCGTGCTSFATGACQTYPICGNNIRELEANETCDGSDLGGHSCASEGFLTGTLRCNSTCEWFETAGCVPANVCGNDVRENTEVCDGTDLRGFDCTSVGFDDGVLACQAGCGAFNTNGCFDAVCPNNRREGAEICDGTDVAGETCVSLGLGAGTLICNSGCTTFNTSGCSILPICGNGVIEAGEVCDGQNLALESCLTLGYGDGPLACASDCHSFELSGCCQAQCAGRVCGPDPVCPDISCGDCVFGHCGTGGQCDGVSCGALYCALGLRDACTCSSRDPCGWQQDGVCDASCASTYPGNHFDDAVDCVCGNGQLDAREFCDGGQMPVDCADYGYAGGTPTCSAACNSAYLQSCTGFATCGDGIANGGEICDGTSFKAGYGPECAYFALLATGAVTCNADCTPNLNACAWFLAPDFCAAKGWYDDAVCDACHLLGGSTDPNCSTYCGNDSDDVCSDYFDVRSGVWTCWEAGYGRDPDCSY